MNEKPITSQSDPVPSSDDAEDSVCHEKLADHVTEAAEDAGIDTSLLPASGTEARVRLCQLAKEYSKEVHLQMCGRSFDDSNNIRRALHSDLCVMIYGRPWNDLTDKEIKQVRNFAHLLSGRDQYVD
jgi:hypothetical protein